MDEKISRVEKVGNFCARLLLGNMKDVIVRIDERVGRIEKDIDDDLKPDIKGLGDKIGKLTERVSSVEGRIGGFAGAASPINLTPKGEDLLNSSGILDILNTREDKLLEAIKKQKPSTAYDVQETVLNLFKLENFKFTDEELKILKNNAFQKGASLNDVLYVAAIRFRDKAIEHCGFKTDDLDK